MSRYADIIEKVLDAYTAIPYAHGDLTCEAVFDRQRGRFLLMTLGWDKGERVLFPVAHVDLINGKAWVQVDNIDCGIARELAAAGIPKTDIFLGFRPPEVREQTEYARLNSEPWPKRSQYLRSHTRSLPKRKPPFSTNPHLMHRHFPIPRRILPLRNQ